MTKLISSTYDHAISYVKGVAILGVIFIHLLDWSNHRTTGILLQAKELAYVVIFMFVACSGALAHISFQKRSYRISSNRVITRGLQLIGIYFLYNIIKLYVYDFSAQPFYDKFVQNQTLNLQGILTLQSFTAPISIILTIGIFLLITPIIMRLVQSKKWKWTFPFLILLLLLVNQLNLYPANPVFDFLLAKNNIMFPVLLWLPVYLLGIYLAMIGFNKGWISKLLFLLLLSIVYAITYIDPSKIWLPREFAYPLSIYYVIFSLTATYLMVGLFNILQRISEKITQPIEMIGESTFNIFIWHLIVIDATRWAYPNNPEYVWTTMAAYLFAYLSYKYFKRVNG